MSVSPEPSPAPPTFAPPRPVVDAPVSGPRVGRVWAALALWMTLALPLQAAALRPPAGENPPAARPLTSGPLGRPARDVSISAHRNASGGESDPPAPGELRVESRHVADLPFVPERLTSQAVVLAAGTLLRVEAQRGGERFALLLSRRGSRVSVLDSGLTSASGDPGERVAHVLAVIEGEDGPRVLRARTSERTQICGAPPTWLDVEELNPTTLRWAAVAWDLSAYRAPAQRVRAEQINTRTARLQALRFDVATSGGGQDSAALAPRPVALTDNDVSSAWVEAEAQDGGVAVVTGRYDATEWPIRHLSIVPLPADAPPGMLPATHVFLASQDTLIRVDLPASPTPGAAYAVELAEPARFRCVSLLLPTPTSPEAHTGLAELTFYSEFDADDGVSRLLAELAAGGARGVAAVRLLRGLGAPAADAISANWPDMTSRERRLALRALSDLAAQEPRARAALTVAARDADPEIQAGALEALREVGAGNELTELMLAGSDDAALVLARSIPARAPLVLLPALAAEGGVARLGLRAALHECATRAPDATSAAATSWATTGMTTGMTTGAASEGAAEPPSVEALALVAASLATASTATDSAAARVAATRLVDASLARASSFEEIYRLVAALGALSHDDSSTSEAANTWLQALAADDERWMVRSAAAQALHRRAAPQASEVARQLLRDEFPRAREAAIGLLTGDDSASAALLDLAQHDRWPRVRAAAVTALAADAESRALLVGALGDPKARVRLATIEAFRTHQDPTAAAQVIARLARENELPAVQRAAVRYLGELCVAEAVPTLITTTERGARRGAYDPDIETATLATAALAQIGTEAAVERLRALAENGTPVALRAAAAQGLERGSRCE